MCGIAGYKTHRPVPPGTLATMVGALVHRGPDSEGFYRGDGFEAGMRRLSIKDLVTGDQPLFNEDHSVALLYNGEIYNYQQIREGLEKRGHRFSTNSDGEVICHLYREKGLELFEMLDGMFAAALWIESERRLILARDIPGEKPLYYSQTGPGEVVFASELKALKHFPGLDLGLDHQAVWDFPTFLWVPEPRTVYRKIKALPRGHILVADDQGVRITPYQNRFGAPDWPTGEPEIIEAVRDVVTRAVETRLMSDVPLGCFLSGGLDSSIVAAIASRRLDDLTTFCIGFENLSDPYHNSAGANEAPLAEAFAKRLGTRHHTIRVRASHFKELLPEFCRYGDQPFSVSSGLGILAIARKARQEDIKVLLSGDGADECFGGYWWYPYLEPVSRMSGIPAPADRPVSFQNFGEDLDWRLQVLAGYEPQQRAWAWHYYAAETEKRRIFSDEVARESETSLRHFRRFKAEAPWTVEDYIRQDRNSYFPQEMLRKLDRMSMAHSVEARPPFAAPEVLACADRLSYHMLVRDGQVKWVLRRAFENLLPKEILDRPKHGFNVPIDHWLKNEWADLVEEAFGPGSALHREGMLRRGAGKAALEMLNDPRRLNGHSIFSFIMLNMWLELNR